MTASSLTPSRNAFLITPPRDINKGPINFLIETDRSRGSMNSIIKHVLDRYYNIRNVSSFSC